VRDQIVEILITFLNQNVNSITKSDLNIDLNQPISISKIKAIMSNLENYYSKLRSKDSGSENQENLMEKVHNLLDENNKLVTANKNFQFKISELEEKLNQLNKENLLFNKEINFLKDRNSVENDEYPTNCAENFNFNKNFRNPLSPISQKDRSIMFSSPNHDYQSKYCKYKLTKDQEKTLNHTVSSQNFFGKDLSTKSKFIQTNKKSMNDTLSMSPLKNIKSKLKDIEKKIVSMKGNLTSLFKIIRKGI